MNGATNVALLNEVQKAIREHAGEMASEVIRSLMGANGETAGDAAMSRGERIARFIEDAETGALDVLKVQSNDPSYGRPTIYEAYVRQYVDDIAHSGAVAAPVAQPFVADVIGVM